MRKAENKNYTVNNRMQTLGLNWLGMVFSLFGKMEIGNRLSKAVIFVLPLLLLGLSFLTQDLRALTVENTFKGEKIIGHSLGLKVIDDKFKMDFTAQFSTNVAKVYVLYNVADKDDQLELVIRNSAGVGISTATSYIDSSIAAGIGWYSVPMGAYLEDMVAGLQYSIVVTQFNNKSNDSNLLCASVPDGNVGLANGVPYADGNLAIYYSAGSPETWVGGPSNTDPIFILEYMDIDSDTYPEYQGNPYATFHLNAVVDPDELCARRGWPIIDVTRRSIEETAAAIIRLYHDREAPALEA